MKKLLALLLALAMVLGLAACTGDPAGNASGNPDASNAGGGGTDVKQTIAVAIPDYSNAQMLMFQDIYQNIIAKEFNVDFIFSEALSNDVASEMQFMENAKSSGATGYITYNISNTEHASNIAAKANDLGLYIAVNGVVEDSVTDMEYLVGCVDASKALDVLAQQFSELTQLLLDDGKQHNVAICTMGASQGSEQHIQSTAAALDAVAEVYDLTYAGDTTELATASSVTELDTGKEDVSVALIPGVTPNVAADVEQLLKGGEYDVLICVGPQYAWYESVISSVEDSLSMDIKTCSIMGIGESTANSFNTLDATGNPSLNAALIKNGTVSYQLFVMVYNAITGNPDAFKVDGVAQIYPNIMWVCRSAEEYEALSQVDSSVENACYSVEELESMIIAMGGSVDAESFGQWCENATLEQVLGN